MEQTAPQAEVIVFGSLWHSTSSVLQVTYSIHTVRVELYESAGDYVRLVLEIILTIWVGIQILSEFWNILQAKRQQVQCTPPCPAKASSAAVLVHDPMLDKSSACSFRASCYAACLLMQQQKLKCTTMMVIDINVGLFALWR